MSFLKNKTVLITGGGRAVLSNGKAGSIGYGIAIAYAKKGANIVITGRNVKKLEEAKEELERLYGIKVLAVQADISADNDNEATVKTVIEKTVKEFGRIDVLINNAGTAANAPFEKVTLEEYDKIMNINVKVPFLLTQKVLPFLKRSSAPTIINIASVTGHSGYMQQSIYSASKHALLGMTKSIAAEYYKDNIRVHAISPGGVYTDMVKVTRPDLTGEGMIMPEDIAEIAYFFLAHRGNAVIDEILVHRVGKEPFQV